MSTSTAPDLTGVHAKLDRAEEHISALRDEIRPLMEGLSYACFETRHNVLDDSYSVIFHEVEPMPVVRWGVIELPEAQLHTSAGFRGTTVLGEPGHEDTRLREFRTAPSDIRQLVSQI
jgi:hypothetical protein